MRTPNAFTLIELLVVITIIVVLLSILAPSLDRAIYVAELTECGAMQRVTTMAATQYAIDNNRYYPKRQNNYNWDALMIRHDLSNFDYRPFWTKYLGDNLAAFSDPFQGKLDYRDEANNPGTLLYSTYHLYPGLPRGTFSAMNRLGQKFGYEDRKSMPGEAIRYDFTIISGDREHNWNAKNWSTAAHPDDEGRLGLQVSQNQNGLGLPTGVWPANADTTIAWWTGAARRGKVDLNFSYADGSVLRIDKLTQFDERMAKIPDTGDSEYALDGDFASPDGRYTQVPIEH